MKGKMVTTFHILTLYNKNKNKAKIMLYTDLQPHLISNC